jgi:hypothetical protein
MANAKSQSNAKKKAHIAIHSLTPFSRKITTLKARFLHLALASTCLAMPAAASEDLSGMEDPFRMERSTPAVQPVYQQKASLQHTLKELDEQVETTRTIIQGLQAQQFSPTTRMSMLIRTAFGGVSYSGNQISPGSNSWGNGEGSLPLRNGLTMSYDAMIFLDTSTTGKDLLRTILRMANFGSSAFGIAGGNNPAPLTQLDEGFEDPKGPDHMNINRLFYSTPINRYATAVFGPRVRQNDVLPVWPTIYSRPGSEQMLRLFTQAGSTSAYTLLIGPGGGLILKDRDSTSGWSLGLNYIASNGFKSNTSDTLQDPGGIGTAGGAATAMAQLSFTGKGWNVSAAVAQNGAGVRQDGTSFWRRIQPQFGSTSSRASGFSNDGATRAISLAGYWQPLKPGLIPSVSAGLGFNQANITNSSIQINQQQLKSIQSAGWLLGFTWDNAFGKSNQLGLAAGQPTFVTTVNGDPANDSSFAIELYYKAMITDNIILTPAIYYLSRPRGQDTQAPGIPTSPAPTFNALGALLEMTLKL